jgi:hypothetical protein
VAEQGSIDLKDLTDGEQLALAALLRLLVRLDGQFSDAEQEALGEIALDFGEKRFWKVMEDAAQNAPDGDAIRTLARGITRQPARDLIYGLVLGVAMSDVIQGGESTLLEWLRSEWKIDEASPAYRD